MSKYIKCILSEGRISLLFNGMQFVTHKWNYIPFNLHHSAKGRFQMQHAVKANSKLIELFANLFISYCKWPI